MGNSGEIALCLGIAAIYVLMVSSLVVGFILAARQGALH
jgi:hypothetical protein